MKQLDKAILLDVVKSLETVTTAGWSTGDLQDYVKWANRMKTTILSVTPILTSLANIPEEKPVLDLAKVSERFEQVIGELTKEDFLNFIKKDSK